MSRELELEKEPGAPRLQSPLETKPQLDGGAVREAEEQEVVLQLRQGPDPRALWENSKQQRSLALD